LQCQKINNKGEMQMSGKQIKKYLSYGGGVNSTAHMILLKKQGIECEAVFADHGGDYPETYEHLEPYYEDGNITLFNNDMNDVVRELNGNSIDLILTDPPYGINYLSNHRKEKLKDIQNDDVLYMNIDMFWDLLRDTGSLWSFYSHKIELDDPDEREIEMLRDNHSKMYMHMGAMLDKLRGCGASKGEITSMISQTMHAIDENVKEFEKQKPHLTRIRNRIIWVKNNWTAGNLEGDFGNQYECIAFIPKKDFKLKGYRHSNVWKFDRVPPSNHPTEKPVALLCRIIESCTNVGDIVFDPFTGSGATLFACKRLNRRFVGSEIDSEHCQNIVNDARLRQEGLGI